MTGLVPLPDGTLRLRVPFVFRRVGDRKRIVRPGQSRTFEERTVLAAIGRAMAWAEKLERGDYASVSDLAREERLDSAYVIRILRLAYLSPDILRAVAAGTLPGGTSLARLEAAAVPFWSEQHARLGLP
ncbi:MAG: hypothetical protein IJL06_03880 [Kiritimatiellae bacterium]|nr:hypothetical protein [Kiritimatiellia bacterium]